LKIGAKGKRHRSVLKRIERLRFLSEKGKFAEGDSVFGLPKIKSIRIKIKKEKAVKEAEATAAAPAAAAAAETTASTKAPAKEASPSKK
jgi:small basic protein (TIGR04137 family)